METATQWYDPELKIAIREELPGGYIRELRDIKTGKQEKDLFEIPSIDEESSQKRKFKPGLSESIIPNKRSQNQYRLT